MVARRNNRGRWSADFWYQHPDGRRMRIRRTSPVQTKRGTEDYERQLRNELLEGRFGQPEEEPPAPVPTFAVFSEEFMTVYASTRNKESEVRSKESILKIHLRPAFGDLRLDEIDRRRIDGFVAAQLGGGLSPKSVNNQLAVLSKTLRVAEEWGVIDAAPRVRQLKTTTPEYDFLTFDEAARLVDAVEPSFVTMVLVALKTGLRQGELLELKWNDADLVAKKLRVSRRVYKGVVGTPKGGKSRIVPLTQSVVEALKAHRHLKGPHVFCGNDGQRLTANMCRRPLRRACQNAGLRQVGWHVLRHTFASHLAMRGVPMKVIQEYLGHAAIQTTMRYAHLSRSILDDAIQVLDAERPVDNHWSTGG